MAMVENQVSLDIFRMSQVYASNKGIIAGLRSELEKYPDASTLLQFKSRHGVPFGPLPKGYNVLKEDGSSRIAVRVPKRIKLELVLNIIKKLVPGVMIGAFGGVLVGKFIGRRQK